MGSLQDVFTSMWCLTSQLPRSSNHIREKLPKGCTKRVQKYQWNLATPSPKWTNEAWRGMLAIAAIVLITATRALWFADFFRKHASRCQPPEKKAQRTDRVNWVLIGANSQQKPIEKRWEFEGMRPSKAQSHCKIAWDAITSDSLKTSLLWLLSFNPISYCVLCVCSPWGNPQWNSLGDKGIWNKIWLTSRHVSSGHTPTRPHVIQVQQGQSHLQIPGSGGYHLSPNKSDKPNTLPPFWCHVSSCSLTPGHKENYQLQTGWLEPPRPEAPTS